ncbi:tetratricopeptide repeat protein [Streptomyces sp. NPDC006654]|uniref:tetratricopeptide repeat protein n=1 Tax=Streptomyces sp. NPDC006654 TaxID=3156897 RepID=UPI0033F05FE1
MAASEGERLSRRELIDRRKRAQFVGRRAQLSQFEGNLAKDPESETDPADFLFHVHGVGGVGKSTLLRQWREAARRAGAVTAVVDENDVHGVLQALTGLARQLSEEAGVALKGFDRAVEQYRREQEAAAEPAAAAGGASPSSRMAAGAALGAVGMIPGVGPVASVVDPEAAARQVDRVRDAVRRRRTRESDIAGVGRAFVAELDRLCRQHAWVVLFFDTWEQTDRYLDQWLRDTLEGDLGPVPSNVMVVLAGRDELAEREWAPLRDQVTDVALDVFTEAETRALLAARGVTESAAVEAVLQLSMGLPLLVELLARTRPTAADQVDQSGDAVDVAVERFLLWIPDPRQRETVLACALAPQLNEDVFAAAVPPQERELWGWLCGQPFVSGHGDFKQYHAIVRASMVRRQRTGSPRQWATAHLRLADTHAAWRTEAEQRLADAKRWGDQRWRRHRLAETYHRLCAHPTTALTAALEETVHAAGHGTAALRQWTDTLEQAARDTTDPTLLSWADRLQHAAAGNDPVLDCLTALLTHASLSPTARAWAHTYRGRRLYHTNHEEEALTELNRAVTTDPHNCHALAYRGDIHRWLSHTEQAFADLNAALDLDPTDAWALAVRGVAHHQAGRYELALADLTAALDLDPTNTWALAARGVAHHQAERYELAFADLNAALDLDPTNTWALNTRGETHRIARRYELALADLTAALDLDPTNTWTLTTRGETHRQARQYELALADLNAALDLDPTDVWALAARGTLHRQGGRYGLALADLTAALDLDPTNTWALAQQRLTRQEAEHPNDSGA